MVTEVERAAAEGEGVIRYEGEMVNEAHVKTAKKRIEWAERLDVV